MTLPLEDDSRPPYVQVAEYLRRQIQSGELSPGDKVPSSRELQEKFGLASATIQNAFRLLKSEELIYSVQGRGSFIRRPAAGPGAEGGTENPELSESEGSEGDAAGLRSRVAALSAEVADLRGQVGEMRETMQSLLELMQQLRGEGEGA
ncbi:GntR family transcriptional regulator [Streptomyces sp. NBC_00401]|uniref:GntR family transcriptional regulator n=1 Tax=Streptomyces sp. NBC_00401 TaxID=2975738 RepID=UPI00225C239E|nr:GntR family transcriptional regulator [Streptomyces sp. NBC_00401]MCX5082737.1 GntR family transcriptional regulator [Streptomyces sp. NBC_00401]